VAICTLNFGGIKHLWVDLKIKGRNRELPLKGGRRLTFLFTVCGSSDSSANLNAGGLINFYDSRKSEH